MRESKNVEFLGGNEGLGGRKRIMIDLKESIFTIAFAVANLGLFLRRTQTA